MCRCATIINCVDAKVKHYFVAMMQKNLIFLASGCMMPVKGGELPMEMKDRIRFLRKELDMTQQEFADRLHVKRGTIATYEMGRNDPIETIMASICREFRVRDAWLRNGEGPVFEPDHLDELETLAKNHGANDEGVALIRMVLELPKDTQSEILDAMRTILASTGAKNNTTRGPATIPAPQPEEAERGAQLSESPTGLRGAG